MATPTQTSNKPEITQPGEPRNRHLVATVMQYSGPLPPPRDLAEYERTYPGAAKIIFEMAKGQASHRQTLESTAIRSNMSNEKVGMWLSFALAFVFASFGFILIYSNKNVPVGFFAMLIPVLELGANFFFAKKRERGELGKKDKQIEPAEGEK